MAYKNTASNCRRETPQGIVAKHCEALANQSVAGGVVKSFVGVAQSTDPAPPSRRFDRSLFAGDRHHLRSLQWTTGRFCKPCGHHTSGKRALPELRSHKHYVFLSSILSSACTGFYAPAPPGFYTLV